MQVLFVCSGNTCRSPLAEAALRAALGPDVSRVQVFSAGIAAADGLPASIHSVSVAARDGVNLSSHRSSRATAERVRTADLVLAMEQVHLDAVRALGADPARSHLLSSWPPPGEPGLSIEDPFGGSIEAYEECWRRIQRHLTRVAPHIIETLRSRSR